MRRRMRGQFLPITRAGGHIRPGGHVAQHLVENSRDCRRGALESAIHNQHGGPVTAEGPSAAAFISDQVQLCRENSMSLHD